MCDLFYSILRNIFVCHVPLKSRHCSRRYPPWYSSELIKLLRAKFIAYKNYKKSHSEAHYREFSTLRVLSKQMISNCYKAPIQLIQSQISSDPSKFWVFVKSKRGASRIPGEVFYNGVMYSKPVDVLNAFAQFFSSAFSDSKSSFSPPTHCDIY